MLLSHKTGWLDEALPQLSALAIGPDENIYSLDRDGRRWGMHPPEKIKRPVIRRFSKEGKARGELGANLFMLPHGLTTDTRGNFWVTDVALHQVLKLAPSGRCLMTVGEAGVLGRGPEHFDQPTAVAVNDDGSFSVADGYGNARIAQFTADGEFIREWGSAGKLDGKFNLPHSIVSEQGGGLFVADRENSRIQLFTETGEHLKTWDSEELGKPFAIDVTPTHLLVADCGMPEVRRAGLVVIDRSTGEIDRFGDFNTRPTKGMIAPHDIACSPDGSAYIADVEQGRIHKFVPRGAIDT